MRFCLRPKADTDPVEIPQCSSLRPGVLSFLAGSTGATTSETARVHHAAWRHSLAARGAGAATLAMRQRSARLRWAAPVGTSCVGSRRLAAIALPTSPCRRWASWARPPSLSRWRSSPAPVTEPRSSSLALGWPGSRRPTSSARPDMIAWCSKPVIAWAGATGPCGPAPGSI